jgi:cytochrome bd-type quinol oxidase subunit 1
LPGHILRDGYINVLALLVFAASFYLRINNGSQMVNGSFTIPVLLSGLGVILISISGSLGGDMVVAVEPEQSAATRERVSGRST